MTALRALLAALIVTILTSAPAGANCVDPPGTAGEALYNDNYNVIQYCNGTQWIATAQINPGAGGSGCLNPTANEGEVLYNNDYHVLQFCDGDDWIAMGGSGGNNTGCAFDPISLSSNSFYEVTGIYGNDTHIFTLEYGQLLFAVDKSTLADVGNYYTLTGAPGPGYQSVFADNTNIFVADGSAGARAFTFDGTDFILQGTYNTAGTARGIWGDGTFIYVADNTNGVIAFTFSGTTWTPAAAGNITNSTFNTAGNANGIWSDGTYVYVADGTNGVVALTFNGSAWAPATGNITTSTYNTPGTATSVRGDGTYIYVADQASGLRALSFNGTAWTSLATHATEGAGEYWQVHTAGDLIYVTQFESADPNWPFLGKVLAFNGTAFALKSTLPALSGNAMWSDGSRIYVSGAARAAMVMSYALCAP